MSEVVQPIVTDVSSKPGFVGRIPVRNLWLLMLYASDLFRTGGIGRIGLEDSPDDLPDLVAEILAHAVEVRQRNPLNLGYCLRTAALARMRGRIDVLTTERDRLLDRGMVACRFDEFTINTLRNRYVRAALESIAKIVRKPNLAHRCRSLAMGMKTMGVSGDVPTRVQMSKDRMGRHEADDQLMVAAAKLAFDLALPTEASGSHVMTLPDREESWVRRLFERAIGGFYDVVLSPLGWRVRCGRTQGWQIAQRTPGIDSILPSMRTDIVMEYPLHGQRIVIDTKFTSIVTRGWFRERTLHSSYLYQMYAYLRSQAGRGDPLADKASGLLLHPSTGCSLDEAAVIQGHLIRFATVDLAGSAADMRAQLLKFCQTPCHMDEHR